MLVATSQPPEAQTALATGGEQAPPCRPSLGMATPGFSLATQLKRSRRQKPLAQSAST